MLNRHGLILRSILFLACITCVATWAQSQNVGTRAGHEMFPHSPSGTAQVPVVEEARDETRPLQVAFAAGKLIIVAHNSSLSEIMGKIASINGMKISGMIPDEPVFGTYGPAEISVVVSTLLQGTDTNVLFTEGDRSLTQLILTSRSGIKIHPTRQSKALTSTLAGGPDLRSGSFGHRPSELAERTQDSKEQSPAASRSPTLLPAAAAAAGGTLPSSPNGVNTPDELKAQLTKPNGVAVSTRRGSADPADNRL